MTAEIAIMNKSAVALATDSAVTVSAGENIQGIYNSANKLFTLSKYHPVGVMIYGSGEFMGVPWETIIKDYREGLGAKSFPSLEETADAFVKFLDTRNPFIDEQSQRNYVVAIAGAYFQSIRKEFLKRLEEVIGKDEKAIGETEVKRIVADVIEDEYKGMLEFQEMPHLPKTFPEKVIKKYGKELKHVRDNVLQKLPLNVSIQRKLFLAIANIFYRIMPNFSNTGLVVAGFGDKDIFPALKSFASQGLVADRFCYHTTPHCCRITREQAGAIIPFAQADVVATFMEGVSPEYFKCQQEVWKEGLDSFCDTITEVFAQDKRELGDGVNAALRKAAGNWVKKASNSLKGWAKNSFADPVVRQIAVLPKSELPAVAEALVNLTSLKRRVTSGEKETVGGPVDVAVISKGDGFIWIKRKHYFSQEFNPHFCARYFERPKDGKEDN